MWVIIQRASLRTSSVFYNRKQYKIFRNTEAATKDVLWKKLFLKNFAISTGKHLCQSLFLINLQAYTYLEEHLRTAAFRNTHKSISSPEQFFAFLLWRKDALGTRLHINSSSVSVNNHWIGRIIYHLSWITNYIPSYFKHSFKIYDCCVRFMRYIKIMCIFEEIFAVPLTLTTYRKVYLLLYL